MDLEDLPPGCVFRQLPVENVYVVNSRLLELLCPTATLRTCSSFRELTQPGDRRQLGIVLMRRNSEPMAMSATEIFSGFKSIE
jgi:hypothetical protein